MYEYKNTSILVSASNTSNLVQKANYSTKINEIEKNHY